MITILLLNWQRRRNLNKIIKVLLNQTIKPKIFLWNNNPRAIKDSRIDWIVNSSKNMYCFPRWLMASMAKTKYIMTLDDDLIPITDKFIEIALEIAKQYPKGIVGLFGKQTPDKPPYYNNVGDGSNKADIIKGRCMIMRTELLKKVPLSSSNVTREDDIYISYMTADRIKTPHFISTELREYIKELPQGKVGLDTDKKHMEDREKFLKKLKEGEMKKRNLFTNKVIASFGEDILERSVLLPNNPEGYLAELIEKIKPKRILEIGTFNGVTTAFLAQFPFVEKVITIDIRKYNDVEKIWKIIKVRNTNIEVKRKISRLLIKGDDEKPSFIDKYKPYDLILIDGDHKYNKVKYDFELTKSFPYILFHDYGSNPEVTNFINGLKGVISKRPDLKFALWKKC